MPAAPLDLDPASARTDGGLRHDVGELLARVVSGACLGGLVVVAAVLLARRAVGGVMAALSPAALLCVGALLAVLAALAQWPHLAQLARRIESARSTPRAIHVGDVLGLGVPIVVASLLAAAAMLPGTSAGAALLLWLPLVAVEAIVAWRHRDSLRAIATPDTATNGSEPSTAIATPSPGETDLAPPLGTLPDVDELGLGDESSESLPGDVTQQWTRRQDAATDVLEGLARVHLAAGERTANLHIAVCPPFAGAAEVFAEAADGPPATVKVAEAHPFGIRLEVRLGQTADAACNVVVAVVARAAGK